MYHDILVPTDGSDGAHAALDHAIAIADPLDAVVHVLAVVDPSANPFSYGTDEVDELNRAAEGIVDELVRTYRGHDVPVRGSVRRGRPEREILAYADEEGIDLLVVGRSGEDGTRASFLGGTTDRLVRSASIPVTIVPFASGDADGE